ncbi:hypothetical protein Aperf_G00000104331 [Anoplocephala perfoliata]
MKHQNFWICVEQTNWPDIIDILVIIFEALALVISAFTAFLLFRIREGSRISLVLLRTAIINNIIDAIVKIIRSAVPFRANFSFVELNYIFCTFWESQFIFWLFNSFSVLALLLFAIDRGLTLTSKDSIRFTPPESRLRTYLICVYVFGFLFTIPTFLYVNMENGTCLCGPTTVKGTVLTLIYASVYLRFAVMILLNGTLYLICIGAVIMYVRQTPVKHQKDELNSLHFLPPSAVDLKRLEESHGWKIPSLCILPIGVFYIIYFGFDAGYMFVSGLGLTTFEMGGDLQKIGVLLMALFSITVPIVLLLMLPVFRFWLEDRFGFFKCCKRKKDISQQLSYSSDWFA